LPCIISSLSHPVKQYLDLQHQSEIMGDRTHAASRSAGFDAFNTHGSSIRVNSEVALQAALRDVHRPDHVTWVKAEDCDILGFAEAGHAKARISDGGDTYTLIRKYQIPARSHKRKSGHEGAVEDEADVADLKRLLV
jgi:hypothetical protein